MDGGVARFFLTGFELVKWIILTTVVVLIVHFFVGTIFLVDGLSMSPTLDNGSILWTNKIAYLIGEPVRGDIVIIRFPGDPEKRKFVKRVIGEPGESVLVESGKVFINGKVLDEAYLPPGLQSSASVYSRLTLGKDEYFLMGDNRPGSNDSRYFGPVTKENFIGSARLIIYPLHLFGYIPKVFYPDDFYVPIQAR